jgi:predicted phosphodiesterase
MALQSVDRIVCLGDIVGYNTNPRECIALLRRAQALCIAGNHDCAICGQITTERRSAARPRVPSPGPANASPLSFKALIAHPSGARICAFGHTHEVAIHEFRDGRAAWLREEEAHLRDEAH